MKTENLLGMVADELGLVKADIKALEAKEEALKSNLISAASEGPDKSFEGSLYRATVSFTNRTVTDWKAVTGYLIDKGVSKSLLAKAIADCTNIAEGLPVVRVVSL